MVKANKNDMTASTLVSSIIIVIKITNWKRKYTLPNQATQTMPDSLTSEAGV